MFIELMHAHGALEAIMRKEELGDGKSLSTFSIERL